MQNGLFALRRVNKVGRQGKDLKINVGKCYAKKKKE